MNKKLLLIALMLLATSTIWAQDAFEQIVSTVIGTNAELENQRLMLDAQQYDEADANSLANPSVDFARVWGSHHIGNKLQLDISQEFEWPGIYSARSKARNMGRSAAEMEIQASTLEKAADVRQILIELVYVRQQIQSLKELQTSFGRLSDAIDKGVKGGEVTVIDQRKMFIENFEIDNKLTEMLSREQQIISSIQGMTESQLDFSGINTYPIQPVYSIDEYKALAVENPAVQAQALASEQEQYNAKAASMSRMPGFSIGYQHQAEMGDRFNGFTVGMSLPFFQNRNARKAAMQRKLASDNAKEALINQYSHEIDATYNDLQLSRSRIEAYKEAFGDNKYPELLLKAYNGGELSVIEYLTEIHYYHEAMLTYMESEYNYNVALTTLNSLINY